jgi:predicted MPP superfamily phosphohydrolase
MSPRRLLSNPLTLLVVVHLYVGWRLIPALSGLAAAQIAFVVYLVASFSLIPVSMSVRSMRNQRLGERLAWAGFLAMGLFSSLFVLTLLRDGFLAATALAVPAEVATLASVTAWIVVTAALFLSVVGLFIARRGASVQRVDIPIRDLPDALHGFSIVQISDIHVGATIKRAFVTAIVDRVNTLKADLIAVTGDVVDGTVAHLSAHTQPLSQLSARHGAFFVTGNHEYYSGEREWSAEFKRLGMTVLKNQHVVLTHDTASLVIAGVPDESAHHFDPAQRSDPAASLVGAPSDADVRLLLAHRPSSAVAASQAGFDLQLSGHTHGGQFWPWNHFVGFFNTFSAGLNKLNDLWVYVNRGTGYWGPPKRFGVPAEITHIRLVPALESPQF